MKPLPQSEDVITIQITYPPSKGFDEKVEPVKIHKSRDVADIYQKVTKTLESEKRIDFDAQTFMLIYRNSILKKELSLKDAGI